MFSNSVLESLANQNFWLDRVLIYLYLQLPYSYFVASSVLKNVNNDRKVHIQEILEQCKTISSKELEKAKDYLLDNVSLEQAKLLKFPSNVIKRLFIDNTEQDKGLFSCYIIVPC